MTSITHRLGLTGSIGAGKSMVADLLRARGLTVLDADQQAREVTSEAEILRRIEEAFPGVVQRGVLDRAKLAGLVFGDQERLNTLNGIVHPRVRERMAELEAQAVSRGETWVVHDIPLLFEGGLEGNMDAVAVVDAPLELRVQRVMQRSGLSRADVLARDARQMPVQEKLARADFVILNSGTLAELTEQVDALLYALHWRFPTTWEIDLSD